jgi:hypothetical protein
MEQFIDYGITNNKENSGITMKFSNINLDPYAKNYSNCDIVGSFYEVHPIKSSLTAFGYEQDEKIVYVLADLMEKDAILNSEYIKTRTIPKGVYSNLICPNDRFFDLGRAFNEETNYRVLFKMDGTIHLKDRLGDLTILPLSK